MKPVTGLDFDHVVWTHPFVLFWNIEEKKKAIWQCSDTVSTVQSVNKPDIRLFSSTDIFTTSRWAIMNMRKTAPRTRRCCCVRCSTETGPSTPGMRLLRSMPKWKLVGLSYASKHTTRQWLLILILYWLAVILLCWHANLTILFAFMVFFTFWCHIFEWVVSPNNLEGRFFSPWLVLFIIYLHYCTIQLSFYQ